MWVVFVGVVDLEIFGVVCVVGVCDLRVVG